MIKKTHTLLFTLLISIIALGSALTAQYVFQILPCNLCLYQRAPFVAAIFFSLIGLISKTARRPALVLCALTFAVNTLIAFYHVGVEQHWWVSVLEGCKVDFSQGSSLEDIMATPSVPCDKPAWLDPVFGQSMAFYNVLLCAGMSAFCVFGMVKGKR